VASGIDVRFTASYGGASKMAVVSVVPLSSLASVSLLPASVRGGAQAAAMIHLANPAPAGGLVVSLSSSRPDVVRVPASVTIPAGAAAGSAMAQSFAVSTPVVVTITAAQNGARETASLTVNP
jgi:hypothetical protein